MSWFSSFDTGEAFNKLSELSTQVQASVNELSTLVPDNEQTKFLRKLALNSPDMVAERSQIDLEERRKEIVRDHLSELLPWETQNEELGIFVEDCREAILALSSKRCTFLLPFAPPKGVRLFPLDEENNNDGNKSDQYDVKEEEREEIMQKLLKMQPLPSLLEDFDIDAHVGLIERLLQEDTNLTKMHSSLTGAGEKEQLFWKNYFFHCAYTRYEKRLTIEEIWERKPAPLTTQQMAAASTNNTATEKPSSCTDGDDSKSVELTFELDDSASRTTGGDGSSLDASSLTGATNIMTSAGNVNSNASGLCTAQTSPAVSATGGMSTSVSSSATSYEIVDALGKDDNVGGAHNDTSDDLDDLEAEIARELEED